MNGESSDSGTDSSASFEQNNSDDDVDMEDASLNERPFQSRARGRPSSKLKGKNGFVWDTRAPSRNSDRLAPAAEPRVPGPKGNALNANTIEEIWSCLFTQDMIDVIVTNTNLKIEDECVMLVADDGVESYHHHTDDLEIRAYLGISYYAGVWKSADVNDYRLWSKKNGISLYQVVYVFMTNIQEIKMTVLRQFVIFGIYSLETVRSRNNLTSYMIYAILYLGKNTSLDLIPGKKIPKCTLGK